MVAGQGVLASVSAIVPFPDRHEGKSAIIIGTFDGVHRGHQYLIEKASDIARARSFRTVALTFDPPPRMVLRPDTAYRLLTSVPDRIRLLRRFGVDDVVVCAFDHEIARLSAEEFCTELVDKLGMQVLLGGPDLALGNRRLGTPDVLREIGQRLGFEVEIAESYDWNGRAIRSHEIRQLSRDGCVVDAAALLGHPLTISGLVVHGDARGRTIGFPTANLAIDDQHLLPGNGVYAVRAGIGEDRVPGVMNVGVRPTVDGTRLMVEVHLLDKSPDLYGQRLSVELITRIRDEQRFGSLEALIEQIRRDVEHARRILSGVAID